MRSIEHRIYNDRFVLAVLDRPASAHPRRCLWQPAPTVEDAINAAPVIRMPDDNRRVALRGHPMAFLLTGSVVEDRPKAIRAIGRLLPTYAG